MLIIDGKIVAQKIIEDLKKLPTPDKTLAAVLVGSAGSPQVAQSKSFLRQKEKFANELGIKFQLLQFPQDISESELIEQINKLNKSEKIGGIILQLPLPKNLNRDKIIAAIDPKRDIDALTSESLKYVLPLPVEVVNDILKNVDYDLKSKVVAVVGRGILVGKPVADYFKDKCKELFILHSKSDLSEIKKADLIITGVGKAGIIKPEMLKQEAAVIDFGYDIRDGKLSGDLDISPSAISNSPLAFFTPTPGGTGPILVAEIFRNFYKLTTL